MQDNQGNFRRYYSPIVIQKDHESPIFLILSVIKPTESFDKGNPYSCSIEFLVLPTFFPNFQNIKMGALANKLAYFSLLILTTFLGVNGAIEGLLFMIRKDGSLLGMDSSWLSGSPFPDFFIPGVCLFLFVGVMPLITAVGLINAKIWPGLNRFNIYPEQHWAWTFSLYSAITSLLWICIQQLITQFFWIQPVILGIGIGILILTLLPAQMEKFTIRK